MKGKYGIILKKLEKKKKKNFFVKTIEKVIRLCTVLKKKLFDWQF